MKKIFLYAAPLLALSLILCFAFIYPGKGGDKNKKDTIKWYTFSEAVELSKKAPRKMFIDVYTDWCGWCKKMDAGTFENAAIVKYLNAHYYPVKMNAEMKDTIIFNNLTFVNPNPTNPRSTHQLAASLLSNKLSYPTSVYLDENFGMLQAIGSYLDAKTLEAVLHFYGEDANKTTKWDDYFQNFQGEVK